jgi:hypothetical protein
VHSIGVHINCSELRSDTECVFKKCLIWIVHLPVCYMHW